MNYGVVRVLAEPIGTRRTDHVTLLDVRVERDVLAEPVHVGWRPSWTCSTSSTPIPTKRLNWASGAAFLQPLSRGGTENRAHRREGGRSDRAGRASVARLSLACGNTGRFTVPG